MTRPATTAPWRPPAGRGRDPQHRPRSPDVTAQARRRRGLDRPRGQRLPAERVRGEAFRELVSSIDVQEVGRHGGQAVSMFVTMTLEDPQSGLAKADLGKAGLSTGETITAKNLTTHECQADGCTVPAAWSESHYRTFWSRGGRTDHDQHDLLCSWHHRAVHKGEHDLTRHPDGTITFHRRT